MYPCSHTLITCCSCSSSSRWWWQRCFSHVDSWQFDSKRLIDCIISVSVNTHIIIISTTVYLFNTNSNFTDTHMIREWGYCTGTWACHRTKMCTGNPLMHRETLLVPLQEFAKPTPVPRMSMRLFGILPVKNPRTTLFSEKHLNFRDMVKVSS